MNFPEKFEDLPFEEMRQFLINAVSSLSEEQAKELYDEIMKDEELKKVFSEKTE